MPVDSIITLKMERARLMQQAAALFMQVFGRLDVCVKGPIASAVTLPGFEDEQLVYMLDMDEITQEERERLIDYIHETFDIPKQIVAAELDERGMPLLNSDGTLTIHNPQKWFDFDDEDGDTDDGGLDWDEPDELDYWVNECHRVGDDCLLAGSEECDFECPFNSMNDDDEDGEVEPWDDGDDAA